MDKRSTAIIVGVVAVAAVFALFIMFSGMFSKQRTPDVAQAPIETVQERPKIILTAKHAFRDGMHTIVGDFELPTPCHLLETFATVAPDGKTAIIDYVVSTKSAEACAQVITPTRYRVQFTAPENVEIGARVNNEEAILNLIEAGPNEDIENLELYIKG